MKKSGITILALLLLCGAFVAPSVELYAQSGKNKKKTEAVKDSKSKKADVKAGETKPQDSSASDLQAAAEPKKEESSPLYQYEAPQEPDTSVGGLIFKTILVLGLMGAGFYFFVKFIMKKGAIPVIGGDAVRVLSVTPVGQNRSLQVIDVGGKVMLIGVTESNISLLSEINGKEEIDRIKLASSKSTPHKDITFQSFLTEQIGGIASFVKDAGDKINRMRNKDRYPSYQQEPRTTRRAMDDDADISSERLEYILKQKERLRRLNGEDE